MAGGRPPSFNSFTCPNCKALYHIFKVERRPETVDRDARHFLVAREISFLSTSCCEKQVAFKKRGAPNRGGNEKPRLGSAAG
jgi:hypothetical protein